MKRLLFALIFLCIAPDCLLADPVHALPQFDNFWYDETGGVFYPDACNGVSGTYTEKGPNPEAVARDVFPSGYDSADHCTWGAPYYLQDDDQARYSISPNFPGTTNDWSTIAANDGAITQKWEADCKNDKGELMDYKQHLMFPSYHCPPGSMGSGEGSEGCFTSNVTVCNSDVAGRDLEAPIIEKAGHVGLINLTGDAPDGLHAWVMEVLDVPPPIIQINTLEAFQKRTTYWGSVYGLNPKQPEISKSDALAIFFTGYDQTDYNPEYTYLPIYVAGHYAKNVVYNRHDQRLLQVYISDQAKFRCDTFIIYSYNKGTNDLPKIPSIGSIIISPLLIISPLSVYMSFLHTRALPNDQDTSVINSTRHFILNQQYSTVFDDGVSIQDAISKAFSAPKLAASTMDPLTEKFIKDKTQSAKQKAEFLWSLAGQYSLASHKFNYLVDMLGFTNYPPITLQLVAFYRAKNSTLSQSEKIHLLSSMVQIISNKNIKKQIDKNEMPNIKAIEAVQSLFETLLANATDKQIIRQAILLYPNIAPPEQAYTLVNKAKVRAEKLFNKPVLNTNEIISQNIELAFATQAMQAKLLPSLLASAQHLSTNKEKKQFNRTLYLIINSVDASDINKEVQQQLLDYLSAVALTRQAMMQLKPIDNITFLWLRSYAKVKYLNASLAQNYIVSTILHTNDLDKLSALIAGADHQTLTAIGRSRLQFIYQQIKQSNHQRRLSEINQLALSRIYDFFNSKPISP